MKVIFDDFRLQDTLMTYDQVKDLIDQAHASGTPIRTNAYNIGRDSFFHTNSLYKATQNLSHTRLRRPKVYVKQPKFGPITQQYAVVVPWDGPDKNRWVTYVVDTGKGGFINMGPKNGAIIATRGVRGPYEKYWRCQKDFTVRVNEGAKVARITDVEIPVITREWVNPTETILLNVQVKKYKENDQGVSFDDRDIMVGIWGGDSVADIKSKKRQWRKTSVWEQECPGLVLDMNRPDFPMDEQDAVLAIMT